MKMMVKMRTSCLILNKSRNIYKVRSPHYVLVVVAVVVVAVVVVAESIDSLALWLFPSNPIRPGTLSLSLSAHI